MQTYLDKLMKNKKFKELFLNELEGIFIDEDRLQWARQKARERNESGFTGDYLKGYRDCWNKLRDKISNKFKLH